VCKHKYKKNKNKKVNTSDVDEPIQPITSMQFSNLPFSYIRLLYDSVLNTVVSSVLSSYSGFFMEGMS